MELPLLLAALPDPYVACGASINGAHVRRIVTDSRDAAPGAVFVAVNHRGYARDGHDFVADAISRGVSVVVAERVVPAPETVVVITVPSTARALAWMSAAVERFPASKLALIGITGTDGKTTTGVMTHAILDRAGMVPGLVTTVASGVGRLITPNSAHTTTPSAPEIQAVLGATVTAGGTCAVIEATSHGIDQGRVDGCEFDVAVVTRVTHDHLDYHGTFEAYLEAKAGLIDRLAPSGTTPKQQRIAKQTILNANDPSTALLADRAARVGSGVITFGLQGAAGKPMVLGDATRDHGWGTTTQIVSPWGSGTLEVALPGHFNALNALAAVAASCSVGVPFAQALEGIATVNRVPGRMERVDRGQPFDVVVDFAHTPDSLEQALRTVRARTKGRVIVVFGCAGERDRLKRPAMGTVAATLGDVVVLTDEDPRFEDRLAILREIADGAIHAGSIEGSGHYIVPDRHEAIHFATEIARPGDVVLLAGKGHETSIIGAVDGRPFTITWNEFEAASSALAALGWNG